MMLKVVMLVLTIGIPARSGGYINQYIPMPDMEQCQRLLPILEKDALGKWITFEELTGTYTQQWGSSELKPQIRKVERWVGVRSAKGECKEF